MGIGSVRIRMYNDIMRTLTKARHIPELKKNIISLSALDSTECRYISKCRVLKIVQCALVIMRVIKYSSLHQLLVEIVTNFNAETSNTFVRRSELWHICLGHIGERSLKILSEKNLLHGDVADKLNVCRCYNLDQQRKA